MIIVGLMGMLPINDGHKNPIDQRLDPLGNTQPVTLQPINCTTLKSIMKLQIEKYTAMWKMIFLITIEPTLEL